jgi:D-alanyl-D-alanine dipeptidase
MMGKHRIILIVIATFAPLASIAGEQTFKLEHRRPEDVVDVSKAIPAMQFDMRYASSNNFVGRRISGYQENACLLTESAIAALKKVEDRLLPMGLTLKAYDCYRPQRAVDNFVAWAADPNQQRMRGEFYPSVPKDRLFEEGYIAAHSGHSRASTIDLTIVPSGSAVPQPTAHASLVDCAAPKEQRAPDNSLDFGTGFDCFSPVSHPSYQGVSAQVKANRLLLQSLMTDAGFVPLETEWWHFTLKDEPYPNTYFDFPVTRDSP